MASKPHFFQYGPHELISIIFECCTPGRDVWALATTCRNAQLAWRALPGKYRLTWAADIVCFEEALIASRMAQVVASSSGGTPAGLYPGDYSIAAREPSKEDMQAVFGLDRLAVYLERQFCSEDVSLPADRTDTLHPPLLPEAPERMPEWSRRVRKAIYRNFIVGAALADVHWEPVRQARASADEEIRAIGSCYLELSQKQLGFLNQFTAYNLGATEDEEDAAYGRTARWIIQNIMQDQGAREDMARRFQQRIGRGERCQLEGDCRVQLDGSHSDAHLLVWEVAQMLWVTFHLDTCIEHDNYYGGKPAVQGAEGGSSSSSSLARVVLIGPFGAEDLIVPELDLQTPAVIRGNHTAPQPSPDTLSSAQVPFNRNDFPSPYIPYSDQVFCRSGMPNTSDLFGNLPPLMLKWFSYVFRRFLGLQFCVGMFEPAPQNLAQSFYEAITIFSHDDEACRQLCDAGWGLGTGGLANGMEILQIAEPMEDLIFEELNEYEVYPFW